MTSHLTCLLPKPRGSICLVLVGLSIKNKGTLHVLPILMKAAFLENLIKHHSAQLSGTVNITLWKCFKAPSAAAGLGACAGRGSQEVTSGFRSLWIEGCYLTAWWLSPFGKMDYNHFQIMSTKSLRWFEWVGSKMISDEQWTLRFLPWFSFFPKEMEKRPLTLNSLFRMSLWLGAD